MAAHPAQPSPARLRICDTENFHVESYDARCNARTLARCCESWRQHLQTKWLGAADAENWNPRCTIVVHGRRESYRAAIGRGGEQTFGSSWIDSQGGRVSARRIDLLIDPQGVISALGHELTHVVIADAFPGGQPPAWANEGIAVLADSTSKQLLHKRDLHQSTRQRTAYSCAELLQTTGYPPGNRVAAFYAHSASLAAFLAQSGTPDRFVPFLKQASSEGYDRALRESYRIDGIAELQRRWDAHQNSTAAWPAAALAGDSLSGAE